MCCALIRVCIHPSIGIYQMYIRVALEVEKRCEVKYEKDPTVLSIITVAISMK